jgi:multidrug efflux pump subunit AcrB
VQWLQTAIVLSLLVVFAGGIIFSKGVEFNIFPSTKDTNQIAIALKYPSNVSIEQAQATAERVDKQAQQIIGSNLISGSYYGIANPQLATLYINLTPYTERAETAPNLVKQLDKELKNFKGAKVDAYPLDVGPPTAGFNINIRAENRDASIKLANDMAAFLKGHELKRPNGTTATITDASVSNTSIYERSAAKQVVKVNAVFSANDTTTLTTVAKDLVTDTYNDQKLESYNLSSSDISFDLGQESENQDSFKTLALAFPLVLLAIYILLAVQFRSLLQPLIIFMAIPFSFFGIALLLSLTDNAFSFFTMLGFFALIGLSLKNTILLTDYANQARRLGMGPVDAAVEALHERFRPLIATSITAVVSLIPLAVTSPFWQGLAVTLIGGLLSSTFLVITIFPYYYLGAEFIRWKTGLIFRRMRRKG